MGSPASRDLIRRAVRCLAAVCDGARADDGTGFAAPDANLGAQVANLPDDLWTDEIYGYAYEMLHLYRRTQLPAFGIDYDEIEPEDVQGAKDAAYRLVRKHRVQGERRIERHGDDLVLFSEYNEALIAAIKALPNRRWDKGRKAWIVPAATTADVEALRVLVERFPFGDVSALDGEFSAAPERDPAQVSAPGSRFERHGTRIRVFFPYNPSALAVVKSAPGRQWDREGKYWTVPFASGSIDALARLHRDFGPFAGADLIDAIRGDATQAAAESRAADADYDVPGFGGPGLALMPFQRAGVSYASRKGSALIGDEMGLGKTVQALAVLQDRDAFPALIVCPAILKENWAREAAKWLPGRSIGIVNGTDPVKAREVAEANDVVIVNYDILHSVAVERPRDAGPRTAFRVREGWDRFVALVGDEAHAWKNAKALRTKAGRALAKGKAVRLLLTGTPVLNRPIELVEPLRILGCLDAMGGYRGFLDSCGYYQDRWGGWLGGDDPEVLRQVNDRLREVCLVRRLKADVLSDLPPKRRTSVVLPVDNRETIERALDDIIAYLRETEGDAAAIKARYAEVLVRFGKVKALTAKGKMAAAVEWIRNFLDAGDEKLVVFAYHREVQEALYDALTDYRPVRIAGGDDNDARQAAVDAFQNDPERRVAVCSLKAAGMGLTLTAASNVAFVELNWAPWEHDQAEDRCHRIGQASSVNAYYLLGDAGIDMELGRLIDRKRTVVDAATDGAVDRAGDEADIVSSLVSKVLAGR